MSASDQLKNTFSQVVAAYDYARPTYPCELYEQILSFAGLERGADLLEVGAGTGQATDLFLDHSPTLLEVSDEQVSFLHTKYPSLRVDKGYFEDYQPDRQFDLIFSATAFHWVIREIGYPKAWHMLKNGGTMAVFWHMSSVMQHECGIFPLLNAIKLKYMHGVSLGFDEAGVEAVRHKRFAQFQSGGCFKKPELFEYRWTDTYDTSRYAALVESYSDTQLLPPDIRAAYLDEIRTTVDANGGKVEIPQHVLLFMQKK